MTVTHPVTSTLARYVVDAKPDDLPDAVRREGMRAILHLIGCAIGGCRHETVEAAAIRLQGMEYRIRNRLELVSTKARRNQDDPWVLRIRRNSFMSKLDEIDDVRGDDRPSFSSCVG